MQRLLTCCFVAIIASPALAEGCGHDVGTEPGPLAAQFAGGADCGHEAEACRWTFDLGVPASRALFEEMRDGIGACSDVEAGERDQGVNHPDFYDAWVFPMALSNVMVSIKDKSALSKTYVVLRFLPKP